MPMTQQQFSSDIYKAQFCRQYFIELKQFLSNFNISDRKDGRCENDLNMHCLLEDSLNAYKYKLKNGEKLTKKEINEKTQSYRDERRFDIHWQLSPVNESDLMLAIEQFFDITSDENYGEDNINLKESRNHLLHYLLDPTNNKTIDFEDYTIRAILTRFNVLEEGNSGTIGNQVQSFSAFTEKCSETEKRFKWALVLLKELRNWKSHQGALPYEIVQLNIFHKYILFTYIGLVYVCRRIWLNPECCKVLEVGGGKQKKYVKPTETLAFEIPEEEVYVIVKSEKDKRNTHYWYSYCDDNWQEIKSEENEDGEQAFTIHPRKYQPFKLKIETNGDEEPFITQRELNYYSWFLTLEINVPRVLVIYKGIAGGDEEIETLVTKLAETFNENLDETIKKNIQEGLGKIEPLLRQLRQKTKESEGKESYLKETIITSLNSLLEIQKAEGKQLKKIKNGFTKILTEYDKKKEAERKRNWFDFIGVHIAWILPIALLIYLYLIKDKWERDLIWLDQKLVWGLGIVFAIVIPIIIIYRFGYLKANQSLILRPWYKRADFAIGAVVVLLFAVLPLTIPYWLPNSFIRAYNFSKHDKEYNEKAVQYTEKFLKDNSNHEHAMIMLATYYLNYTKNIKEALRVTKPMRNPWEYKEGAFFAAEALYKQGDYAAVRVIFDEYKKAYNDQTSADFLYLRGVMQSRNDRGYEKNIDKCREDLLFAVIFGEVEPIFGKYRRATKTAEAAYELGYLLSHDTSGFSSTSLFVEGSDINYVAEINNPNGQVTHDTLYIPAFNLPLAAFFLRKAAPFKPEAALELANIYSDLNMSDSALYYYNKVINVAKDTLQYEAIFRKSLVFEREGKEYTEHKEKTKIMTYEPERLHRAISMLKDDSPNKDYHRIIDDLKNVSQYNGRRYLPPIVFAYLQNGEKNKALKVLQEVRKDGNFDMEFIEGMDAMLRHKGSTNDSLGMSHMQKSALQGCKYAKMICMYREIESGKYPVSKFDDLLKEIGESIPFAYALACRLAILADAPIWACKYAAIASGKGHPAGALVLTSNTAEGKGLGSFMGHILAMNNEPTKDQIGMIHGIRQLLHACARFSPNKLFILEAAYLADNYYYRKEKKKAIPFEDVHLWSNAAIANKLTGMELQLLILSRNLGDETYLKKLIESSLSHIDKEKDSPYYYGNLSLLINTSSLEIGYIDSLMNVYKDNPFKQGLLSQKYVQDSILHFKQIKSPKLQHVRGDNYNLSISISPLVFTTKLKIDDRSILNEFSDFIQDDLYDRPLRYE